MTLEQRTEDLARKMWEAAKHDDDWSVGASHLKEEYRICANIAIAELDAWMPVTETPSVEDRKNVVWLYPSGYIANEYGNMATHYLTLPAPPSEKE